MGRSEEHTSELQSPCNLVCRLLLEKKKHNQRHVAQRTGGRSLGGAFRKALESGHACARVGPGTLGSALRWVILAQIFFFNDTATTEIYTLSLHDALPICCHCLSLTGRQRPDPLYH